MASCWSVRNDHPTGGKSLIHMFICLLHWTWIIITHLVKCIVCMFSVLGHKDSVTCTGFSHDGKYVATADMSGLVQVWKVISGECIWTYECSADLEVGGVLPFCVWLCVDISSGCYGIRVLLSCWRAPVMGWDGCGRFQQVIASVSRGPVCGTSVGCCSPMDAGHAMDMRMAILPYGIWKQQQLHMVITFVKCLHWLKYWDVKWLFKLTIL